MKLNQTLIAPLTEHERRVKGMMIGFGQDCPTTPTVGTEKVRISRARLKLEETVEFCRDAGLHIKVLHDNGAEYEFLDVDKPFEHLGIEVDPTGVPNLAKMVDALSDDSVVNVGSFVAFGVAMSPMLELTDENNLMKIANGKLDEHGKFQKSPTHPVPNYEFALALQGYDPATDPNLAPYRPDRVPPPVPAGVAPPPPVWIKSKRDGSHPTAPDVVRPLGGKSPPGWFVYTGPYVGALVPLLNAVQDPVAASAVMALALRDTAFEHVPTSLRVTGPGDQGSHGVAFQNVT